MKLRRALFSAACCALCVIAFACGGGKSGGAQAPDNSKIPTATLPSTLPEPKIINAGAIQPGGGSTYTIKSGDTLADIADRFGVSLEDLRAANPGNDALRLVVGDTIQLPTTNGAPAATQRPAATATSGTPAAPPPATDTPPPVPTDTPGPTNTPSPLGQTYTVASGDIPQTIAAKFNITIEELLAANPGINPNNLQVGQVLIIPKPAGG